MHPLRTLVLVTLMTAAAAPARAAESRAFVFSTDYATGTVSTVDFAPAATHCDAVLVNSDASLRWYGGELYVVNRLGGDNVQVIDPVSRTTVRQFSVGNGSNPHDIAFASPTKAYVTRFDATDLWIVNPATGAHTGTIALAGLADADGNPEMDRMMMVGPLLFVSLERVNRNAFYAPTDSALVAVVDTRADTLVDCDPGHAGVQGILLQLRNPFTTFQFDRASSRLLLGCVGAFGALDGGVERIDPVALRSDGVAIGEAALGGDVNDVVWGSDTTSWAIVADAGGNTKLVAWSAITGAATGTLWNPGGYVLTDAELDDRGLLWACRADFSAPAVRRFSAATGLPQGSDLTCSLPPTAVTFDAASSLVAGVAAPEPMAPSFLPVFPNPARSAARLDFTLARGARVRLDVLDAQGRRVRRLADGEWAAGRWTLPWDLADDAGRAVPPGLYLARLDAGGRAATRRVIVIR
jgi:hypothetical protein